MYTKIMNNLPTFVIMDSTDTIILITEEFPLGGITEKSFVLPDVLTLSRRVKRVIIVPLISSSMSGQYDSLPDNVEVCTLWCDSVQGRCSMLRCVRHLFSSVVLSAVRERLSFCNFTYAAASEAFSRFLQRFIRRQNIDPVRVLVYSFWFNFAASGAYLASTRLGFRYIVRAHGYDFRMTCAKDLRRNTVSHSDGVYVCSSYGASSLGSVLNISSPRIEVSYLGVRKHFPDVSARYHTSGDKQITVLSVARVISLKRVDMNLKFMKALALARPSTRVKWIHVGDGENMADLAEESAQNLPSNLEIDLRGALDNKSVHEIYRDEVIDWIMLLSEHEALGLVLVEAMAYGVPAIAAAVEGIPEVVTDECGILLDKDSSPEEFVRGIVPYLDSDFRMEQLRLAANLRWQQLFDAERLREEFADKILI